MKKFLSVLFVAGILTACDNNSSNDTDKKEQAADSTQNTKVEEPAAANTDVPTFADKDVQKMAEEYAVYMKDAMSKDPAKMEEYTKKSQEWATKTQEVMTKLASSPEEMKKWTDFLQKLAQENMPK